MSIIIKVVTGGIGRSYRTPGLRITTTRSATGSGPVPPGMGVVPALVGFAGEGAEGHHSAQD